MSKMDLTAATELVKALSKYAEPDIIWFEDTFAIAQGSLGYLKAYFDFGFQTAVRGSAVAAAVTGVEPPKAELSGSTLKVEADGIYKLRTLDTPRPSESEVDGESYEIPIGALRTVLPFSARSTDKALPVLRSVLFTKDAIIAASTNRMCLYETAGSERPCVMPSDLGVHLAGEHKVKLEIGSNLVRATVGKLEYTVPQMAGEYPDIQKVLGQKTQTDEIDREDLVAVLEPIAKMKLIKARLIVDGTVLKLKGYHDEGSTEQDTVETQCAFPFSHGSRDVRVLVPNVLASVKACDADRIKFGFAKNFIYAAGDCVQCMSSLIPR